MDVSGAASAASMAVLAKSMNQYQVGADVLQKTLEKTAEAQGGAAGGGLAAFTGKGMNINIAV